MYKVRIRPLIPNQKELIMEVSSNADVTIDAKGGIMIRKNENHTYVIAAGQWIDVEIDLIQEKEKS